jgi:hypothetical protein
MHAASDTFPAHVEAEESKSERALREFIDAAETVLGIARQYAQVLALALCGLCSPSFASL